MTRFRRRARHADDWASPHERARARAAQRLDWPLDANENAWLEEHLATQRYLVGEQITEADVRLFTTLVRFDPVYHGHFKCNRVKLDEMPNLWGYARDLYQRPAFRETTNLDHIKRGTFMTGAGARTSRVVPAGPIADWDAPHDRDQLG